MEYSVALGVCWGRQNSSFHKMIDRRIDASECPANLADSISDREDRMRQCELREFVDLAIGPQAGRDAAPLLFKIGKHPDALDVSVRGPG